MPLLDFQSNLTILTMDRNNDNGDNYNGMSTPAELQEKYRLIINEIYELFNVGYTMRSREMEWELHSIKMKYDKICMSKIELQLKCNQLEAINTQLQQKIDANEASQKQYIKAINYQLPRGKPKLEHVLNEYEIQTICSMKTVKINRRGEHVRESVKRHTITELKKIIGEIPKMTLQFINSLETYFLISVGIYNYRGLGDNESRKICFCPCGDEMKFCIDGMADDKRCDGAFSQKGFFDHLRLMANDCPFHYCMLTFLTKLLHYETGPFGLSNLFPVRCLKCHSTKNRESHTYYCRRCIQDWSREENGGDRCSECHSTSDLEKDVDNPGRYYCPSCWEKWYRKYV